MGRICVAAVPARSTNANLTAVPIDSRDWPKAVSDKASQTLQDRLLKEPRLRGISTIETANAYAAEFTSDFNARFGSRVIRRACTAPLQTMRIRTARCAAKTSARYRRPRRYATTRCCSFSSRAHLRRVWRARGSRVVCDCPDGRLEIMEGSTSLF
ncbi:Integrase family protein (fragment) [Mesorhizobium sp. ORS 3324]